MTKDGGKPAMDHYFYQISPPGRIDPDRALASGANPGGPEEAA
jgi:hypothetical protein